jgi:hypothetical protein
MGSAMMTDQRPLQNGGVWMGVRRTGIRETKEVEMLDATTISRQAPWDDIRDTF